METTVDNFGRIILPEQVRSDFGLAPGAVLQVEEIADGILLKPVPERAALTMKEGVLVFTGQVEGDLESALQRNREERARHLAGLG
jgi:AbrB family looped-hinge helix DNA binding protein